MAPLKKYLVPLTQAALELLAEGINPAELVKPVLMEVEQPPDPKTFIMSLPEPLNWPKDLPDVAWQVALAMQTMGLKIKGIDNPQERGQVVIDETVIDPASGMTGWFGIWRKSSGHSHHSMSCSVMSTTGHWIPLCSEHSENIDVLLRKLNYAVNVVAPRIRLHGIKAGMRQAKEMMTRLRQNIGEGLEQDLIRASRKIKHSGDYGTLYFHPKTKAVHWTAADSDGMPEYTDTREIPKILGLPGVTHVEVGDEWSPDEDEGWVRLDDSLTPAEDLATSLLLESPQLKTLKAARRSLRPEEREQAGAARIWKAEVNGETWYCSNTHRSYQAHKSLSAAVRAYHDVVEPSG